MVVIELRHDTLTPGFGHGDESGFRPAPGPIPAGKSGLSRTCREWL
jgi:hypothetical protein